MANLITKADIQQYIKVTNNTLDADVNRFITEAQQLDLQPLLGPKFYYDFVTNKDTNAEYTKLFDGGTYSPDDDGVLIEFTGVKQLLCYYAYNRLLLGNNESATRTGFVEKNTPQSYQVSGNSLRAKSTEILASANQLKASLETYIQDNKNLFPLYKFEETSDENKPAFRMFSVTKNRYRH